MEERLRWKEGWKEGGMEGNVEVRWRDIWKATECGLKEPSWVWTKY